MGNNNDNYYYKEKYGGDCDVGDNIVAGGECVTYQSSAWL